MGFFILSVLFLSALTLLKIFSMAGSIENSFEGAGIEPRISQPRANSVNRTTTTTTERPFALRDVWTSYHVWLKATLSNKTTFYLELLSKLYGTNEGSN